MNVTMKQNGSVMEVTVDGRIDLSTAPELEEALNGKLNDISELIFDFSNVEYISSAGLRVILAAHKQLKFRGTTKVIHANDIVRSVFEVTGFTSIITVE